MRSVTRECFVGAGMAGLTGFFLTIDWLIPACVSAFVALECLGLLLLSVIDESS